MRVTQFAVALRRTIHNNGDKGRTVIVTGGAQGIGAATCLRFAKEGDHVFCGDLNQSASAQLLGEFDRMGNEGGGIKGSLEIVHGDMGKRDDCLALVDRAFEARGRVDILFNNVGVQPPNSMVPIHETPEEVWDLLMNVNLKSAFHMMKAVIPHMIKQKEGVIVNNASIQGLASQNNVPAYAATKGAMLALTRQIAVEYGKYNIRCNAVCPGSTLTPLMLAVTPVDYVESNTPLPRLGRPEDIAGAVFFLASPDATWITGQHFTIDGGVTVKGGWNELQK